MPLKKILDELYYKTDRVVYIKNDPVEFPHNFSDPRDVEIAAFIASSLAYGRVSVFKPVIERILELAYKKGRKGELYEYIMGFDPEREKERASGIKYRMSSSVDFVCFLFLIKNVLVKYGSLGRLFLLSYKKTDANIRDALARFTAFLLEVDTTLVYGENLHPRGLLFLVPSPQKGSACKRLNMFLRWMIRPKDGVDFGLWDIPASKLVMPVDTHIAFISLALGLTSIRSPSWKMAEEITGSLKKLDPHDPVKYDFALAHIGISHDCMHKKNSACSTCRLAAACMVK